MSGVGIVTREAHRERGNDLALAATVGVEHRHAHGVHPGVTGDRVDGVSDITALQGLWRVGRLERGSQAIRGEHRVLEARDILVGVFLLLAPERRKLTRDFRLREGEERL